MHALAGRVRLVAGSLVPGRQFHARIRGGAAGGSGGLPRSARRCLSVVGESEPYGRGARLTRVWTSSLRRIAEAWSSTVLRDHVEAFPDVGDLFLRRDAAAVMRARSVARGRRPAVEEAHMRGAPGVSRLEEIQSDRPWNL
jgi:hypothetical protein